MEYWKETSGGWGYQSVLENLTWTHVSSSFYAISAYVIHQLCGLSCNTSFGFKTLAVG
jgi:hypothetical protein